MATGISWTQETWNPWYGCKRVSPGCLNCYADRDMTRYGKDFDTVQRAAKATFEKPLKWKEPTLIFTCSWSDFFIHEADDWREEAWEIIKATPQHTYQILTKRPGLMVAWAKDHGWPDNAWAGTTVESQKYAPRLDVLARVPAKVRFVSYEPALGAVNFLPWLEEDYHTRCPNCNTFNELSGKDEQCCWKCRFDWITASRPRHKILDWLIAGGESGPNFRQDDPDWYRVVRDQCVAAGVLFFLKQYSGFRPGHDPTLDGQVWNQIPGH